MPLSRKFPGTTREAGASQPAEVIVIDASGNPVDFSALGGGDETKPTTSTTSSVASSVTVVTLLAANTSRLGALIYNDGKKKLHIKLGAGATLTDFTVQLDRDDVYELPFPVYTGIITGIWDVADGDARITELT